MREQASAEAAEHQSKLQMEHNLRVQVYICLHIDIYRSILCLYMDTRNAISASRSFCMCIAREEGGERASEREREREGRGRARLK